MRLHHVRPLGISSGSGKAADSVSSEVRGFGNGKVKVPLLLTSEFQLFHITQNNNVSKTKPDESRV